MGYQFSPGWPYTDTTFPSMDDHVDPVNNAYFAGLHNEVEKIEYYLGIHPQGAYKDVAERLAGFDFSTGGNYDSLVSIIQTNYDFLYLRDDTYNNTLWNTLHPDVAEDFDDVKDKLETHGHTGGTDGKILTIPIVGTWEEINFIGTPGILEVDAGVTGGSYGGFAYYDLVYLGPCDRSAGSRYIQCFNTTTDDHDWQVSTIVNQPTGCVWTGQYGVFSIDGTPGSMLRFDPLTWEEIETALDSGDNYPRQICEQDANIWGVTHTSPGRIFRYTPSSHAHTSWTMDAGENEILACCTDGTYIWACCNTDPVKLIKFKISDKTHVTFTLTGVKPEIVHMFYYGGLVYMFSDNATVQWARFDPVMLGLQRWEPDLTMPFRAGSKAGDRYLLTLSDGNDGYVLQFDPDDFTFYLSTKLTGAGNMKWITYANDHIVWVYGNYKDLEATITIINP